MTIDEIITVLQNKLGNLQTAKNVAIQLGQLETLAQIESDIISTQASLEKLQSL